MELFDTHAHLDDSRLYDDIDGVLERAVAAGVMRIATIGCDWQSSLFAVRLAERYSGRIYAAIGVHPHEAKDYSEETAEKLYQLALLPQVVAWGEIGLDFHYDHSPRDVQRRVFRAQIALAKEVGKPMIIHDREAHEEVLAILHEEKAQTGIFHCFSGSWEMAKICLNLGFYISFAGPVTFSNSRKLQDIAANVPLDRILVETDCPYLSPEPWRGRPNQPAHVAYVAEKLAAIRGLSGDEMAAITTANACRIYDIL